jgi:3-hydroxyacyl-[acyl-carrier-protein] dehydratase
MLLNDFFRIESLQQENTTASATLRLDPEHAIFKGHFPGRPVVPGACLLQLVQEIVSLITGKECRLLKGDQLKFITAIDPRVNETLQMTLTYKEMGEALQVSADLSDGTNACFRFKGTFRSG